MKNDNRILLLAFFIVFGCSSGRKAMDKGDYFSAVSKSVQRLKANPNNSKAASVLKNSYPLAIAWAQEEVDLLLTTNEDFKWDKTLQLMQRVNNLAREVRQSPTARKIIPDPKVYTSEMGMVKDKAAEERYKAGVKALEAEGHEAAREAYFYFQRANEIIPGYKDVAKKITVAKDLATTKVILETIPVHAIRYKLTSEFFYSQVFEFLNHQFTDKGFVRFYSPSEAKESNLKYPDMVIRLRFYDFEVGNLEHFEKEEVLTKKVEIESKDTLKTEYKTYNAKLKAFTDKASSRGLLDVKIIDFASNKLLVDDKIPGEFVWVNNYAIFVGDKEALDKEQLALTKRKAMPLPSAQGLFIEFTKPMYSRLTAKLRRFFKQYG
ncbi:MAG: hypothetical protein GXO81_10905 [Chlorobi bacterium]|nr:hypothetical protein [Chlorobiota bacterium]